MATIGGFISAKLQRLGIRLTGDELEVLLVDSGLTGSESYTTENAGAAKLAILTVIPEILAMPDISEDSFSFKFNSDAVIKYIALLSSELGVNNPMEEGANDEINDASYIW